MRAVAAGLLLAGGILLAQTTSNSESAILTAFRRVNPAIAYFRIFDQKPIHNTHLLLVVGGAVDDPGEGPAGSFWLRPNDAVGLFLSETADRTRLWELAVLPNPESEVIVKVERADSGSAVIARVTEYGIRMESTKLFFDARSRRLLKVTGFDPVRVPDIVLVGEKPCFVGHHKEERLVACWEANGPRLAEGPQAQPVLERAASASAGPRSKYLPIGPQARFFIAMDEQKEPKAIEGVAEIAGADYRFYKLPQSSYEQFSRARPDRVKDGYTADSTEIGERIGPYQIVSSRLWFGKEFYDGEGMTGVGAIGYFDPPRRKYVLFSPPEIADWSVSSILVEDLALWAGLARNGEGARDAGGLLLYDQASGHATTHKVDEVILKIVRWKDALLLGTENGLYVLRDGRLTSYVFEPSPTGAWAVIGPGG